MPLLHSGLWPYRFSPKTNEYVAKQSISSSFDNTDLDVRVCFYLPMKVVTGQKGNGITGEGGGTVVGR